MSNTYNNPLADSYTRNSILRMTFVERQGIAAYWEKENAKKATGGRFLNLLKVLREPQLKKMGFICVFDLLLVGKCPPHIVEELRVKFPRGSR